MYTLLARRQTDQSDVPDSKEDREGMDVPEFTDRSVQFGAEEDSTFPLPEEQRIEDVDDGGDERDDQPSADEEDEETCWLSNPSSSHINIDNTSHSKKRESIIIESKLQESFIKMVQKGANPEEWNQFCDTEKKRKMQDKDQWKDLKREKEKVHIPSDASSVEEEVITADLPDPSETLRTPEPEQAQPSTSRLNSCGCHFFVSKP